MMKLTQLMSTCLVKNDITLLESLRITAITQYIDQVKPGSLFVCIHNTKYNGHDFIHEALHQGATAIVVEQLPSDSQGPFILVANTEKALAQIANLYYGYPSKSMRFIGVTGTNGKTTTTYLLDQILAQAKCHSGLIGTLYNKIGQRFLPTPNTTPHTVELQQLLAEMASERITDCVIEVSSHGLKQERVLGIDFFIAVFTNFTQDHLDFHPSMADYFQSKSWLFSRLGNSFLQPNKLAVINIDDPCGPDLVTITPSNCLTYGCQGLGDLQAINIQSSSLGTSFTLKLWDQHYPVTSPLIGQFNVYNMLAAFGAAYGMGIESTTIIETFETIQGVPGRFEIISNEHDIITIVDFAHTPDALERVLQTAKELTTGHLYCVFGCSGNRDFSKRPMMAEIALHYTTQTFLTTNNPREEDPYEIISQMIAGLNGHHYHIELDRKKAIELALSLAKPGDILLVAGMGRRLYPLADTPDVYTNDSEVLTQLVKTRHL